MIRLEPLKQGLTDTLEVSAALTMSKAFSGKMHYITEMSVILYLELFLASLLLLLLARILLQTLTQEHQTSLEDIPGPCSAKYTRLCLLETYRLHSRLYPIPHRSQYWWRIRYYSNHHRCGYILSLQVDNCPSETSPGARAA